MKAAVKYLTVLSVLFYVLCWFSTQPTKLLHYIGIALPWLSLLLSIVVGFSINIKNEKYIVEWGYVYALATILYVIAVSIISGSVWHQLPHLATCACLIAYFTLEKLNKNQ